MMSKSLKQIDRDLLSSMLPTFIGTHIIDDIFSFFVDAYIAVIMGELTDAIISHDIEYLERNALIILGCLGVKIVFEPLFFAFFSSKSVYGSTIFIRKMLMHYLQKPYITVSLNQAGDIPSRIDNDMVDFVRMKLKQLGNRIMIPVFFIYLIFIVRKVHFLYVVIAFMTTSVAYLVPIAVRKINARFDSEERKYRSEKNTLETELATNAYIIQGLHLDLHLIRIIKERFEDYYQNTFLKKAKCQLWTDWVSQLCQNGSQPIIIMIGAYFAQSHMIGYGEIASILLLTGSMKVLLERTCELFTIKPVINNLYNRLQFFLDTETVSNSVTHKVSRGTVIENEENIIEGRNLALQYDDRVIWQDFSFVIPRGKITLVKGSNGSGKSTLLRMLCGFEKPDAGEIWVNQTEISYDSDHDTSISLCAQDSVIFQYISPWENAELGFYANENKNHTQLADLFKKFSLTHLDDSLSSESLSGGESQKIKISRALLKEAELLLLDEPENHLDSDGIYQLVEMVLHERRSIIIVSHSQTFEKIADHIITIDSLDHK